jgi:hypothetical protein
VSGRVYIDGADARLELLLLEGLAYGEDIELTPAFWRKLRAEAARIIDAKSIRDRANAQYAGN